MAAVENAPVATDVGAAREVLARQVPDLRVESIEALGDGWDHVAYLVNEQFVFRLPWELVEDDDAPLPPRHAEREARLLEAVRGRLPVAVPEPVFVATDGNFFGYPYLAGLSIADRLDVWVDPRKQASLASLVVDVAVAIEAAVPVEMARGLGLDVVDRPDDILRSAVAGLEASLLSSTARAAAEAAIATYAERWEAAGASRQATLHADLGLDHWLIDVDGRVYALIDWSDACVAPPEHQLSTLMWDLPPLAGKAAAAYEARTGRDIDDELILADGCLNALGDLGELLEEGDDAGVSRCLTFLETWTSVDSLRTAFPPRPRRH